ncbi:diaminopropionate ammonia-lyase [Acuticoccus mangrovi]|uniref:Diaminopropionate ammonia-lyase n=1 Tax=Acuticoccus mangrovi TaxID=2796142 RepID=A0A934IQ89_9HYPH|nr:diaminopropionate ammonia-lyase [Acuticoccus mangrovi]MBJ3778082.1 diaminopropionate ammonia-lyase [Acuticoccus mangrovi]
MPLPRPDIHFVANGLRRTAAPYGALKRYVSRALAEEAFGEISAWRGYRPTPLIDLPKLAARCGVSDIRCKDEGDRFGIGSFKALGGAYAVARALRIAAGGASPASITVATASDGNHGLSVAWGARRAGCRCVVFLHAGVSAGRQRLIEAEGATVVRVDGTYDMSTATAAATAERSGWLLVPDTAPQFDEIPRDVMAGYGTMILELQDQYGPRFDPTHVFLQGGCGGLAAAVCGLMREADNSAEAPTIVVVEPDKADCLYRSALAGTPVVADGALDTVMSGLSVGEVSALAWPVLAEGVDVFMTIPDEMAVWSMQAITAGAFGDPPIGIGDSGVAGLAGLIAACAHPAARETMRLGPDSRVLVIATEGVVDRESTAEILARDLRAEGYPASAELEPIGA